MRRRENFQNVSFCLFGKTLNTSTISAASARGGFELVAHIWQWQIKVMKELQTRTFLFLLMLQPANKIDSPMLKSLKISGWLANYGQRTCVKHTCLGFQTFFLLVVTLRTFSTTWTRCLFLLMHLAQRVTHHCQCSTADVSLNNSNDSWRPASIPSDPTFRVFSHSEEAKLCVVIPHWKKKKIVGHGPHRVWQVNQI